MAQIIYPTEWQLGKPRGSISDKKTTYKLVFSPPDGKQEAFFFAFSKYKNKQEAYKAAEQKRFELSNSAGLTRNRIRYLDKDTIEVELTQDKTFKTDAKFIDKVETYPMNVKCKSDKIKERYYVMCQDKKNVFQFTDLICNYKIVEYINGDTLDVRESNIKEFGELKKELIKNTDNISNQYEYFKYEHSKLPKNIWLLGKPSGTIFQRTGEEIWTVRIIDEENKQHTSTFKFDNSKENAYEVARKWQIETSYKLGLTKNLIKVISDDIIEVQLTKNMIMKTDFTNIDLIQKYYICSSKGSNENAKYYAMISIDGKEVGFHNHITKFKMVDHIDRDTMNNTINNLREATHKVNNNNRNQSINSTDHGLIGVEYKVKNNKEYYRARIKQNNKEYAKEFHISKYGKETAKKLAIAYREYLNTIHNCFNGTQIDNNKYPDYLMPVADIRLYRQNFKNDIEVIKMINNLMRQIMRTTKIIKSDELSDEEDKKMYDEYFHNRMLRYQQYSNYKNELINEIYNI
jgi:hypothetical protein